MSPAGGLPDVSKVAFLTLNVWRATLLTWGMAGRTGSTSVPAHRNGNG
ncbi:hypothetical protein [Pseudonocardia sp. GCM10023141]